MVDRQSRLRLLRQRLEIAREDGHDHEVRRIEIVIANVEREIEDEAKRQRLGWSDGEIAFKKRDG